MTGSDRFAALMAGPDESIGLAEGALLIAQEQYPALDVGRYLSLLDALAEPLRARLPAATAVTDRILSLNRYLFDDLRFRGAADNYYDPRNSFLNDVIDRREGIPITLSIVYIELGRRIGLPLDGVSFPGHFLVRCPVDDGVVILDPFNKGTSLGLDQLQRRIAGLQAGTEPPARAMLASMLEPAGTREILARVLRNLKGIYLRYSQWAQALGASTRLLQVHPRLASEWRERGELHLKLECFRAALADLQRYLELAPDADDADAMRARVVELQRTAARLN